MSDKYSIGTGSLGDDDFDSFDSNSTGDNNDVSQPSGGLFDGISNTSNTNSKPTQQDSFSSKGLPNISKTQSGVPDFLVGDLNQPEFLASNTQPNQLEEPVNKDSANLENKEFEFTLPEPDSKVVENKIQTNDMANTQNNTDQFEPIPVDAYDFGDNNLDFSFEPESTNSFAQDTVQPNNNFDNFNSFDVPIPPVASVNNYDRRGNSSMAPKVLFVSFIAIVSLFVFVAVTLNNYLPAYEETQQINSQLFTLISLQESADSLSDEMQNLNLEINNSAYEDMIETQYWDDISSRSNRISIALGQFQSELNTVKSNIDGATQQTDSIESELEFLISYVNLHIDISEVYQNIDELLIDINDSLNDGDSVSQFSINSRLNEIEQQRDNIENYSDIVSIQSSSLVQIYIQNIDDQIELIQDLSDDSQEIQKEFFDEDERQESERFLYSGIITSLDLIDNQINDIKVDLEESKSQNEVPEFVIQILEQVDNLNLN